MCQTPQTLNAPWITFSMLNQVAFCARRAWWIHRADVFEDNVFTLEGRWIHRRVDLHVRRMQIHPQFLHVFIWSDAYRIYGYIDVLEESDGEYIPVEFKRGTPLRKDGHIRPWPNDAVQVIAQAIALEERLGLPVPYGYVYYAQIHRRVRVQRTPETEQQFLNALQQARAILSGVSVPDAQYTSRCRGCSLFPVCLPKATRKWQRIRSSGQMQKELNPIDF